MILTLMCHDHKYPIVKPALSSETGTIALGRFTLFWLAMIEEARTVDPQFLSQVVRMY